MNAARRRLGQNAFAQVDGGLIASSRPPEASPPGPKEDATQAARKAPRIFLALTLVVGAFLASPALADTKSDLDAAKRDLQAAQQRLNQATAAWNAALARLAETQDDISTTRAQIAALGTRIDRIQARLQRRAVVAFENGPASTIDVLLSSGSFSEFSDRLEFLGSVAQGDSDLMVEERVATEQLQRKREDLAVLSDRQASAARDAGAAARSAGAIASELQSKVDDLTAKYKEQLAANKQLTLLGQTPMPGAAIAVCPVAGPNSFVDSFGWPRPGGRVHEGIDLISPYGTPVVAVNSGSAVQTPNSLGGNAVIVYHAGGTWTYYAHLSSYGASGSVSTNTVIGYVGSTGDAGSVNHLHFEYHPGGGAAVDPYNLLRAVC